ncbi:MAG: hypothetical protein ACE5NN_07405, partial [Candidatus Bathyarchaeia archaeon]
MLVHLAEMPPNLSYFGGDRHDMGLSESQIRHNYGRFQRYALPVREYRLSLVEGKDVDTGML